MSDSVKLQSSFFSKYTWYTLGFYLLAWAIIFVLNIFSHAGPCNPGTGTLVLFLMPVFAAILFIITCTLALMGRKAQIIPTIIHGIVLLGFGLLWLHETTHS